MTSNVNTVSALTMVLGLYQIIAVATFYLILIINSSSESNVDKSAEFQVPHDELDAAQAKIDQLMQDLEIERIRRREAETKCCVGAAKIHAQSQTLASVTAERDQLMDTMKELAFARSLLANQLLVDSDVDDDDVVHEEEPSEEQVDSMIDDYDRFDGRYVSLFCR
ncbi:hypothetical protein K503DRAFT_787091 [Rhizopogon vinicolor AM-OR11-026]|uniref:Uncharacterized protein n=1 Tax=Rhizopogon vinicolor AM-OR11-026 TaxID=1314800 RepID=A0A1B7MJ30_9AGAM|nr:hypothetical protein K503DRAFT_787091 [Rhizopogon vinicolor AM-OR11-026]